MTTRYELQPLAAAIGIDLNAPTDNHHPTGHQLLAELIGVTDRTIRRWATHGIPPDRTDWLATHIAGQHPANIWPHWTDDLDAA